LYAILGWRWDLDKLANTNPHKVLAHL
jgi:hypothetical protein